jgi:hypothetical protein
MVTMIAFITMIGFYLGNSQQQVIIIITTMVTMVIIIITIIMETRGKSKITIFSLIELIDLF